MDNNSHVSISPSSFFSRPNDPSCLHPGSTSSPIYLDNNFIGVGHVSTISPLPPQLSTAAEIQHHDRPARILRDKPTNKVHRAAIPKRSKSPHNNSARVPLGPYSNRATTPTNIVSPPPPLPTPTLLHSSLSNIFPSNSRKESYPANPLSHSDSYIPNITASSSNNTLNQPNITPASSNFANLAHAPTKRKSSDSKRRRGSSSHANRANPANPVNLANPANHANPNNPANPNPNNLANLGHRGNPASNALYNTNNAMSNSGLFTTSNTTTSTARSTPLNQTVEIYPLSLTNSETINQDENMKQQGEHKSTLAIPKQEPDTFANSHAFSTPTTTTTTTSTTSTNNNNSFNNSGDANNMVHNNIMNNNARKMVANYPFAVMPNSLAYYNYFNGMPLQHMYVSPHPLMYQSEATPLHDPNVRIIDNNPSVNQGATNEVPTSYQQPNLTNPNDIYSYLYFNNNNNNNNAIGYNNTAYGNNNNPHPYARTTPPPDASPYNIYNYSNLYNNMYEYPNYTSNNARNFSQGQAYMNTFGGFAEQSNPEQHPSYATEGTYREDYTEKRTERSHRSKRSKRSTRDSDDESRKSRKSKSRSRSKHKSSTRHSHPSDDELPDYELLEFSTPNKGTAYNGPPSPYLVATKPKKANLFENTPKIKLGEPEGAKTKISKLGKKLLEAVGLDWSVAPFVSFFLSLLSFLSIFYFFFLAFLSFGPSFFLFCSKCI